MALAVGQINLNHCRIATAPAAKYQNESGLDIMLLQDPYVLNNKLHSFPLAWRYVASRNNRAWLAISNASIIMTPIKIAESSAFIEIQTKSGTITLGSQYIAPAEDFIERLNEWENLVNNVNLRNFVLGGDFNARSPFWGYGYTDERGTQIMDLLIEKALTVQNDPHSIPTFETGGRKGWPDLTLARTTRPIIDWRVQDTYSASDHKYATTNENKSKRLVAPPSFRSIKIFNEDVVGVQRVKKSVTLNRPIYVGWLRFYGPSSNEDKMRQTGDKRETH